MRLRPQFTSLGVNRVVNALDWGPGGLIAYGGHWIVAVYDPAEAAVVGSLVGHQGTVDCVQWLPESVNPPGVALLLSGAADTTIRLWAWMGAEQTPPWHCVTQLQAHSTPVTSLAVQVLSQDAFLLASTSADPQLQLWHCVHSPCSHRLLQQQQQQPQQQQPGQQLEASFGASAWQQQPPVHVGSQIQHCVALTTLPEDPGWVLMATGGTDSAVRLFLRGPAPAQGGAPGAFELQCQLRGHENWVRGVAFAHVQEAAAAGGSEPRTSLLLASAAQDRYGRVWCITTDASRGGGSGAAGGGLCLAGAAGAGGAGAQAEALRQAITRYAPRPHLSTGTHTYWASLEALLVGHEDWLHSISWRPPRRGAAAAAAGAGAPRTQPRSHLALLTASQDRSMMLWRFDAPSGLWVSEAAVGDAGASCLGFYGGAFGPRGDWLAAHGFSGALHIWRQQQQQQQQPSSGCGEEGAEGGEEAGMWLPQHALGGHFGAVVDLAWGGDGGCLHSAAADQTARLFTAVQGHWFELARTQVHGHDFNCLASIPTPAPAAASDKSTGSIGNDGGGGGGSALSPALLYVSGSEEKVLRVFEAPQAFLDTLVAVRGRHSPEAAAAVAAALAAAARSAEGASSGAATVSARGRALGASVAALGLSNKAVYVDEHGGGGGGAAAPAAAGLEAEPGGRGAGVVGPESYADGPDFVPCAVPAAVQGPPLEEHLSQNTLWPEVRKLYGHGNDVFCVCSSPNGRLLASACKAQSAGAAPVWVWEVGSWRSLAQLAGHALTVTQLEFSPDGRLLLSGSRDRSFSVWRVPAQLALPGGAAAAVAGSGEASNAAAPGGDAFELLLRLKAAHGRIIWAVSWSHDSRFFATGSRDQTVKFWAVDPQSGAPQPKPVAALPPFAAGVTAVALAPRYVCESAPGEGQVVAVGLQDGQLQVWAVDLEGAAAGGQPSRQLWASQPWEQHAAAVRRLRWAPPGARWVCGGAGSAELASCGEDHSVRVFGVQLA